LTINILIRIFNPYLLDINTITLEQNGACQTVLEKANYLMEDPMIKKKSEMKTSVREKMRGGQGSVLATALMDEGTVEHCRLFSEMKLEKGCSIGLHDHVNETEYYWITNGTGIVSEADGEKVVSKGDMVITGGGASHAIRNEGDEPLTFVALIILD
jgi:mannose-6-phosphate isomerase-like protein (cupin superfamily)